MTELETLKRENRKLRTVIGKAKAIFDEAGTDSDQFHGRFSIEVEPKIRRLLKEPRGEPG